MQTTQIEWIRPAAAAEILQSGGTRNVLLLAQQGKIKSKRERDPERGNQVAVWLHAGDVERLKYEREHPPTGESAGPQGAKLQTLHAGSSALLPMIPVLTAIVDRITAAPAEPLQQPYVYTLKRAREVSGYPLATIRRLSIKIDGRRMVNRLDLERYAREHRQVPDVSIVARAEGV